jgi:signal transduction histidine kinase
MVLESALENVLITEELARRPAREPDYESENRALNTLAQALATGPDGVLERLVEAALALCKADSAGVSILDTRANPPVFRWHAITGLFAEHVGGGMPRAASPCGTVLDRNSTLLFSYPERYYRYEGGIDPPIVEALLEPFHRHGEPVGTVWVIAHSAARQFDAEDTRVLRSLARFAAAIHEMMTAKQILETAEAEKTRFLAVLGHELRNPLASLAMGVELLRRSKDVAPLDFVQPMMERQVACLARQVDDLLNIARISQGKIELSRTPMDLREAIAVAIEQCEPLIAERRHALVTRIPEVALPVEGDSQRLAQAFVNLIRNAAVYTPPSGRVVVAANRVGNEAVVSVADNGLGIPPDQAADVFRMFAQLPEHREMSEGSSLGVGLALSRQLIDLHGGSIDVHSQGPGQGSEFIVRLPLTEATTRHGAPVDSR